MEGTWGGHDHHDGMMPNTTQVVPGAFLSMILGCITGTPNVKCTLGQTLYEAPRKNTQYGAPAIHNLKYIRPNICTCQAPSRNLLQTPAALLKKVRSVGQELCTNLSAAQPPLLPLLSSPPLQLRATEQENTVVHECLKSGRSKFQAHTAFLSKTTAFSSRNGLD